MGIVVGEFMPLIPGLNQIAVDYLSWACLLGSKY